MLEQGVSVILEIFLKRIDHVTIKDGFALRPNEAVCLVWTLVLLLDYLYTLSRVNGLAVVVRCRF